jgi:acyl-CoA synthetase (AMP-forming)/AMP-acid ligase II
MLVPLTTADFLARGAAVYADRVAVVDRLAHYKCPTSVDFVDALPRTVTGKVQKFRLRDPYWAGQRDAA